VVVVVVVVMVVVVVVISGIGLCFVEELHRVDDDRHVTEGFSADDEGYQMKDAAGRLSRLPLDATRCSLST